MSTCKQCGGSVLWKQTEGKWRCFNSGTTEDHWDTCSKRRTAAIIKTGEYFENNTESGYLTDKKKSGVFYMRQSAGQGNTIRVLPCNNCVPPWEVCPNSCVNAL